MSDRMPAGPALDQLRELISILRELGNAGPRDNSFKQWRQVTLTLLQRVWANDQARAARFRRIPFSAPSSRADANAIRDSFARGVNEASAYLQSLVKELEADIRGPGLHLKRPPEVAAPAEFKPVAPAASQRPAAPPPPSGPIDPSLWEPAGPTGDESADTSEGVVGEGPPDEMPSSPADSPAAAPQPDVARSAARPRQRLKDMLGFSDEEAAASAASAPSSAPESPAAARPPASAPPRSVVSVSPPPRPPAASPAPTREIPPPAPREERRPPLGLVPDPPPPAGPGEEEIEFDFDFTDVPAPAPPAATLREMIDRRPSADAPSANGAAREVTEMAARLDQLGVPKQRRAMVRAALLDLADQMEAPPVDWASIRQAFAFVLEYPQIARRVIPMLVPFLDEAA